MTGTPWGAAAPTAARTIAASRRGRAGTAAPPPLRVTLAAGQPKLRSMWSTSPSPATRSTARAIIAGSDPYSWRLRGCSSGPNVIIRCGLGVAVDERGGHHHLVDVDEPGREAPTQRPERRVGDAGHRRQDDRRGGDEVSDAHVHVARRYRAARAGVQGQPLPDVRHRGLARLRGARKHDGHGVTRRRLGTAPTSSGVGPSRRRRCQPAAAIIAALSVHIARLGR